MFSGKKFSAAAARRSRAARRGTTLVEFAFAAPILFTFLFAAIEFSRMNMLRHSIEYAAYEGCRRGIVPGATQSQVLSLTNSILDTVSARNATVQVTPANILPSTTHITVDISLPVGSNGWMAAAFFAGKTLTTSCRLEREKFGMASVP